MSGFLNEWPKFGETFDRVRMRVQEVFRDHAIYINSLLRAQDITAFTSVKNIFTNVQAVTPYRANISGAVTIDLNVAKSNNLHLTLTGNVSSFALTNPTDGAIYNFRFIQDGTGSRTFAAFPAAFKFPGGTAPTFSTAANAVDFLSTQYGSTEGTYMCSFLKGMA